MKRSAFKSRLGRYIETGFGDERVRAFVPPPLPPDPPIHIETLLSRLSAADRAVGRLDGINVLLPDISSPENAKTRKLRAIEHPASGYS